jgi:hypothetical protein
MFQAMTAGSQPHVSLAVLQPAMHSVAACAAQTMLLQAAWQPAQHVLPADSSAVLTNGSGLTSF